MKSLGTCKDVVYEVREEIKTSRTIDVAAYVRERIRQRDPDNADIEADATRVVRARTAGTTGPVEVVMHDHGDEDSQL